MLHYIKGKLEILESNFIVVDVGGVGYKIFVPTNSEFYIKKTGEEVTVFTSMVVREDDMTLYGFEDVKALDLFSNLTSVSGVGAKAAMAIFSALHGDEIKKAIVLEDADTLTRANGIGKKTAQRIVLDLKDKFRDIISDNPQDGEAGYANQGIATNRDVKSEIVEALVELGYSRGEALEASLKLPKELTTIEEGLKYALKSF